MRPLLGVIGLLLWSYLTALAIYPGIAFAAQLEAIRAEVPGPRASTTVNIPDTQLSSAPAPDPLIAFERLREI